MFDPSRFRFAVSHRRQAITDDPATRDRDLAGLLAEAMVGLRLERGDASRAALRECGFTDAELNRLGDTAQDLAASDWHSHNYLEPAA